MRTTERLRFGLPSERIEQLRARSGAISEQVTAGRRVIRPSDDPLDFARAAELDSRASRLEVYDKNLGLADGALRLADSTLAEASENLLKAKETAIDSLSSVKTADDAENLAQQVESLRAHLLTLANTKSGGRGLFGGFLDEQDAYSAAFAFQGDTNAKQLEVGDGVKVAYTLEGGAAFGDGTAATVDVFDNLTQLAAAIRAQDEATTEDELERLETSLEQIAASRAQVGTHLVRVDAAESVRLYVEENIAVSLKETREVNLTKAVSELKLVDSALEATLAVSSGALSGPSLMDFLN